MGGNRLPWNLKIQEAKPIPLLMLQTNATMVTMTTPNWAAQVNPEDLAALMDQEDQVAPVVLEVLEVPMVPEGQVDPATTLPMSKTSCRNS